MEKRSMFKFKPSNWIAADSLLYFPDLPLLDFREPHLTRGLKPGRIEYLTADLGLVRVLCVRSPEA